MRSNKAWIHAGLSMWSMTIESMAVIGLRTARIAAGGKAAEEEARMMVDEKVDAAIAFGTKIMTGGLGTTPESALAKTLAHYRPKVRANRKRLSKG